MNRWRFALLCVLVLALAAISRQPAAAAPLADTTYIVQAGDSLTRIAALWAHGEPACVCQWPGLELLALRRAAPGHPRWKRCAAARAQWEHLRRSAWRHVDEHCGALWRYRQPTGLDERPILELVGLCGSAAHHPGRADAAPGQSDPPPSVPSTGGTHIVQRGNTLFSIARTYGTTVMHCVQPMG